MAYLDTITLDQAYDAVGNRTSTEWAFGTTEVLAGAYVFNDRNQMTQLTRSSNQQADEWHRAVFGYNALGQFDEINRYVGTSGSPIAVAD